MGSKRLSTDEPQTNKMMMSVYLFVKSDITVCDAVFYAEHTGLELLP